MTQTTPIENRADELPAGVKLEPVTIPTYIQDDVKIVREYIADGSIYGSPHAKEAFDRIVATLEQWGGGPVDDRD